MGDLLAMHDLIRDNHPGPVDAQNPGFRDWLDGGETALLVQSRAAESLHDYQTVLRIYANGFADGHLGISFSNEDPQLWPGFLAVTVARDRPPSVSVIAAGQDAPAGIRIGDTLTSCGGVAATLLLQDRVIRPGLNAHVPQRLRLASTALMAVDEDDRASQWPDCVVSAGGRDRRVTLRWRPIAADDLAQARMRASGIAVPQTGLRQVGDVWLVSMPSFYPQGQAELTRLQDLVGAVKANAHALHAARHVVLDMRGNTGGDSAWGFEVAEALWGDAAVSAVEASMPSTIDWRVSARNASSLRGEAAMIRRQGQADAGAYFAKLADRMDAALRRHDVFMREPGDPVAPVPHLTSPFAHPVYLLTTPHCASACLDFADLMNGLAGVARIGLETSSDTDYLEVAQAKLPSGKATLRYAMKVYRQRKRGANESYRPDIAWPGGDMNDATITAWVDGLP
jgi:hypothetical protein